MYTLSGEQPLTPTGLIINSVGGTCIYALGVCLLKSRRSRWDYYLGARGHSSARAHKGSYSFKKEGGIFRRRYCLFILPGNSAVISYF